MTLTPEQLEEMRKGAEPLVRFLRKNCHPHTKIVVEDDRVELVEGLASTTVLGPLQS